MINRARNDEKNIAKESIIEQTYCSENLPPAFAEAASRRQVAPLCPPGQRPYGPAAKEGEFLPFVKGGKEGFSFLCPHNYGLTNIY
jgi:hypothetical protein